MKAFQLQAHEQAINLLQFNFDGDLLFSAGSDKKINLWDAYNGERLGSYQTSGAVYAMDLTTDSKILISGTLNGFIDIFEIDGGKLIGTIYRKGKVRCLQFSYGNKQLLILYESLQGSDMEVKIVNVEQYLKAVGEFTASLQGTEKNKEMAEEQIQYLKTFQFNFKITQLKWGLLNKFLIGSTENGELVHIDPESGEILKKQQIHDNKITKFDIAKDHSLLMTASPEGGKLVDPATLEIKRTFKFEVSMNSCSISPLITDRNKPKYHCIMAGGVSALEAAKKKQGGFDIHLLNIMYGEEIGQVKGHFSTVNTVAFHQDGRGFCSAGEEGIVRMYRFGQDYFDEKNKQFE